MTELKRKAAHTSFWISLAYVGLGTIMFIIRISPDNSIMQILVPLVMILTIPVIFIGFGIFYGGGQESIPLVLLVQLFIFLITWYIVYSMFLRRYKKELLIEDYKDLKEVFHKLVQENLDVNNAQTWIYTFIDINEYSLNKVFNELKKYNYQLNTLSQNSKGTWTLEVKREEVLTPKKLAKRNLAFQELAMKYHVDLYEGWSVVKD